MSASLRSVLVAIGLLLLAVFFGLFTIPSRAETEDSSAVKVIIVIPQGDELETGKSKSIPQLSNEPTSSITDTENHFHILIKNISSRPIYLFNEGNSEGCRTLSLKITEADGKKLVLSHQVDNWGFNQITTERLAPGECQVREIYYATSQAYLAQTKRPKPLWHQWSSFPFKHGGPSGTERVTIRAVFEQTRPPSSKGSVFKDFIWLGKVESKPCQVLLEGDSFN